jgi:hypothetical protein
MGTGITQQFPEQRRIVVADSMTSPHGPQTSGVVSMRRGNLLKPFNGRHGNFALRGPLLQNAAGVPDVPVILPQAHLGQFDILQLGQVHFYRSRLTVADFVDASITSVVDFDFPSVAGLHVVPVDEGYLAIGTIPHVEYLRRQVTRQ